MNLKRRKDYDVWLSEVVKKEELSVAEIHHIIDGQLLLPANKMDCDLIQECLTRLDPTREGREYPKEQETWDKVMKRIVRKEVDNTSRIPDAGIMPHRRLKPVTLVLMTLLGLLLIGTAIASALGINIWSYLFYWDNENLNLEITMPSPGISIADPTATTRFGLNRGDEFDLKLRELNMNPLLPTWLPDDFALVSVETSITTDLITVLGYYGDQERSMQIIVEMARAVTTTLQIEKGEVEPIIYERSGKQYFIVDNLTSNNVYWISEPYKIKIGGSVTQDELVQIVDSIYEGE